MKPDAERFTAKTTVLIENVRHHIEEEEQEWFPKVREGLGRNVLQDIGAEMIEARKHAPKRPSQPSALKKTLDAVIS
jgi:hemerythrin-like domain-containing protein